MAHRIEEHECFDILVKESGSDATFEKAVGFNFKDGTTHSQWVLNLYRYTPALRISNKRGSFIPNFCPMCGEDFREEEDAQETPKVS